MSLKYKYRILIFFYSGTMQSDNSDVSWYISGLLYFWARCTYKLDLIWPFIHTPRRNDFDRNIKAAFHPVLNLFGIFVVHKLRPSNLVYLPIFSLAFINYECRVHVPGPTRWYSSDRSTRTILVIVLCKCKQDDLVQLSKL
jgi:hypothetical protein